MGRGIEYAMWARSLPHNMGLYESIKYRLEHEYGWRTEEEEEEEEASAIPKITPTELAFSGTQPSCFYPEEGGVVFRGYDRAKRLIDVKLKALERDGRFKALLSGPAGTGKTTLAWIIAKRLQEQRRIHGRFFELLPAQIATKDDLDVFMKGLQAYDIVFIDEVHILKSNVGAEPLYHTLADTGNPRYPLGAGEGWIDVPTSVSWIAATTEPGELDGTTGGALRRRLAPEIRLEPPGEEVLVEIVRDQPILTVHEAAEEMARRAGGLPWQVLSLYRTAADFATSTGSRIITMKDAEDAFDVLGVDANGLGFEDREVIRVLLQTPYRMANGTVRYKMSENALCAAAGVDRHTYKEIVQPRLMRLGYLTTVGGQCLTQKALEHYQ